MTQPKIAVVGIPGKWSTEVLADAIAAKTGFRLVVDIEKTILDLRQQQVWFNGINLCELDGIIIKKISQTYSPLIIDRLEILRFIENTGVKIFSQPEQIIRLVDRMSCTVTLANGQIPMPATCITENPELAIQTIQNYGEAIFKPLYSTKARGMIVLSAKTPPAKLAQQVKTFLGQQKMAYIQQKIKLPSEDMGLMFLGGEYQGAYARVGNKKSWNTTIRAGGCYAKAHPSEEVIELARKAQALFNLSYTTVDIALTEQGPVCFEVSAFGGFKGAKEGLGLDMASRYADYVFAQIPTQKPMP